MELSHDDSILRTATIKKPNTNFLLNDSVARLHPPGLRNILRLYSPTHFFATEIGRATFVRMPDNSSRLMANLNARISDANRTVEERSILCVGTERLELDKVWSTDCSRGRSMAWRATSSHDRGDGIIGLIGHILIDYLLDNFGPRFEIPHHDI